MYSSNDGHFSTLSGINSLNLLLLYSDGITLFKDALIIFGEWFINLKYVGTDLKKLSANLVGLNTVLEGQLFLCIE